MMSFLLPITTMILIGLGAFCIFTSMDNDRRIREKTKGKIPFYPLAKSHISYMGRTDQ